MLKLDSYGWGYVVHRGLAVEKLDHAHEQLEKLRVMFVDELPADTLEILKQAQVNICSLINKFEKQATLES